MKITQPDSRGAMFLTLTLVCCDGMVEVKMQSTTALRRSGPEEGALQRANALSLNLDLSSLFLHSRSFILESQNKNKTTAPTGSSDFHFTQARSAERISEIKHRQSLMAVGMSQQNGIKSMRPCCKRREIHEAPYR